MVASYLNLYISRNI